MSPPISPPRFERNRTHQIRAPRRNASTNACPCAPPHLPVPFSLLPHIVLPLPVLRPHRGFPDRQAPPSSPGTFVEPGRWCSNPGVRVLDGKTLGVAFRGSRSRGRY
ncbi:hypothetical protein FA13DRAFT_364621 [Coprinellus micaceus]|uniref:Uncharacterized protein n=1 Tax=Coprinellus micaceus TaxID=71717 RepID=A0A4Y7TB42_COPMI|nr:hypothetical protein FA13DRAFT_364621 [Coprinellus micaceus]